LDPSLFEAFVVPTVVIVDWAIAALIVIVAEPCFVVSATEDAVNVTFAGFGALAGAVKVAEADVTFVRLPQEAPEQPDPENDHVTPCFAVSFCSVAVKEDDCPTWMVAVAGETETEIGGAGETVMLALADFVGSETDVAVSVTEAGLGTEAGAE
jgi:hypothetical protein